MTLNAIVGFTTTVFRSIFVIWFRKMLVFLSLYSCPSPNGEKMPTPYANPVEAFVFV